MRSGFLLLFAFVFLIAVATNARVPVSVMMPLDYISSQNVLQDPAQIASQLATLKNGGVDGVMTDVWWGLVENSGPKQYNWSAYLEFAKLVQDSGLTLQVVMSFHKCGTNVGDACFIPLPQWIGDIGQSNPSIYFIDRETSADDEYLTFGVDNMSLFQGRTAVEIYRDYMQSFADTFSSFIPGVINQVQVGMGPAGELRYPGYQLQNNKWTYCGIGEFQCYDSYLLADLKNYSTVMNQPQWGNGGPSNAGTYDNHPSDTGFFSNGNDNYASPYGEFFLGWYQQKLLNHADEILSAANSIFSSTGASIAGKIAGIHWWYGDPSHAAEVTSGYYNTDQNNGYLIIANLFTKYNAWFDFTALELVDSNDGCDSEPQELVSQTIEASKQAGVGYSGENALPICNGGCNQNSFNEIVTMSSKYGLINRFTYLRLNDDLISGNSWSQFQGFVQQMNNLN